MQKAGLPAEREQRPHLHPRRAEGESLPDLPRLAVPAREVKGHSELADLRHVHGVLRPVDRLAVGIEARTAAGRRVVSARRRPLDDEAIDPARGLPGHGQGEHVGGDDRIEGRSPQL